MKIVFLVPHLLGGGAERTVAYLANYISRNQEDEITVLSLSDDVFYKLDERVNFISLGISHNNKNIFERLYKILLRSVKVRRVLKDIKPDVVFCMLATIAKYLPKKRSFKLICSERSNPLIVKDKKQIKIRDKILLNCDGIVFQTKRAKECFLKEIQDKGVVIPNAVGNPYVLKAEPVDYLNKTITAMGRFNKAKGYPTLIKAFKIISEKHPEFILEIFGGGNKEDIEKLVSDLNLSDKVKFMGAREDAVLEVSKSTCYVLSSIYEGMPNALMEAMAVGTACVSTDCPFGPSELIVDGVNGLLVPVGDENALANAVIKVIENDDLRLKLSQNAKKILETNSVEIIAEKYYQFIKNS